MNRKSCTLISATFASAVLLFSSCKKHSDSVPGLSGHCSQVPFGDMTQQAGKSSMSTYTVPDAWGTMMADNQQMIITDTAGSTSIYDRKWMYALFGEVDTASNTSAGTVAVNGVPLTDAYGYWLMDTMSANVWNNSGNNVWTATGGSNAPAISQTVPGALPVFSGTLPSTVSSGNGVSFTFNSGNVTNGDSAYIVLCNMYEYGAADAELDDTRVWSNVVSASGGTATISQSKMTYLANRTFHLHGKTCYGIVLFAVIYSHERHVAGGKSYVYVRQQEIMKTVVLQ